MNRISHEYVDTRYASKSKDIRNGAKLHVYKNFGIVINVLTTLTNKQTNPKD